MVALAATLGATVIGAAGSIQQGKAAEAAAKVQSRVLTQRAESERAAAEAEAEDFRRQQSRVRAANIARSGAAGVDVSTGTPLLVDDAFVRELALGSSRLIQQGDVRGTRLEQQSLLERLRGRSARRAGSTAAFGTILSGVSKFAEQAGRAAVGGGG